MNRLPNKSFLLIILIILFPLSPSAAEAPLPDVAFDFSSEAIAKGKEIYTSVCRNCHSLKYVGSEAMLSAGQAKSAFGKVPPDLSLMAEVKGRGAKGAKYINALLVSFNNTPEKNAVYPNIAMPPSFPPGDPELKEKAKYVAAYLYQVAHPSEDDRKSLGKYVLAYMIVLTALLYARYRRTRRHSG